MRFGQVSFDRSSAILLQCQISKLQNPGLCFEDRLQAPSTLLPVNMEGDITCPSFHGLGQGGWQVDQR